MIIPVTNPCAPLACPPLYDPNLPLEVEVGSGSGHFLTHRAQTNPSCQFLGIERMLGRVRSFDSKVQRLHLTNAHVVRLEALYTFHYLLPEHHIRTVYVFFPDPWPKRRHHSHRLFGPLFLNALYKRLIYGGRLEFATDHAEYFQTVETCFQADARFRRVEACARGPEEWTEFETRFRALKLPIYSAAWQTQPFANEQPLAPLTIPPEDEPRANIPRRTSSNEALLRST